MKIGQYILSLDQGTTSSRAVLFDALGGIAGMGQREFTQIYPQPGYVEHDAVEILQTQLYAMRQAVHEAEITAEDIAAISITNQRETTVAWDSETGIPICNAIVWQCRRTAPYVERLVSEGYLARQPVPGDRRQTLLACTEKAGPLIEAGRALQKRFSEKLTAGLTAADKEALHKAMTRMDENIDDIRKNGL